MKLQTLYLGNDINTDDIIPAHRTTNPDPEHQKHYVLEYIIGIDKLLEYEVIEAGENFGCGSSREYAAIAIKAAGIQLIKAKSFAEIFYRNCINIGLSLEIIDSPQNNAVVNSIIQACGLIPFNKKRLAKQLEIPASKTKERPMTIAEKMLARASGNHFVEPGEVVFVEVDLAMSHDAIASPVFKLFHQHFGESAQVWNSDNIVLVADHFIQVNDIRADNQAPKLHQEMVEFAKRHQCKLFDVVSPGEAAGICHVLLPEQGLIKPGMIIAGTDSHSCTYGAFGSFATGVGTTDMANILATGDMWIKVPATIVIQLEGVLPPNISAKDIMLFILGKIGCQGAVSKILEFRGNIIEQMDIDERMTLSNMAIECGAMCGLIAPDNITRQYLDKTLTQSDQNSNKYSDLDLQADPNAHYEKVHQFDLTNLEPQIACPPKPDQVVNISELASTPIDVAFVGSCTGGKLTDLAKAAEVLDNQKIADSVKMYAVPASQQVREQAEVLGYLKIFEKAGVQLLKSGCGACINSGKGILGAKQTGIYATNRNFLGRSGDPTAHNYLASPRVVAISAIKGEICDKL